MKTTRIEDIPTLEAAKTEIARLTVDNRNLKAGLKIIVSKMETVEFNALVDVDCTRIDRKILLYHPETKNAVGNAISVLGDTRKLDAGLFAQNIISIRCIIDLNKLLRGG